MAKRQLLIDSFSFKLNQLQEQAGAYEFRGKFAQADTPTSNNRIYPRALWERELKKLSTKIAEGKVYGELDHPDDGKTKLQRSAVLLTGLTLDNNGQVLGSMRVLDTSMGKELKAIADGGGAIGVSSRGYGSVRMNEDGHNVVQDDFTLMTFDPVADPAEESAYLELEPNMKRAANESEDAKVNASPMKNEPVMPGEEVDAKDNSTDYVMDAPKGNVDPLDAAQEKEKSLEKEGMEVPPESTDKDEAEDGDIPSAQAAKPGAKPATPPGESEDITEPEDDEKPAKNKQPDTDVLQSKKESRAVQEALDRQKKTFEAQLVVAIKEAKKKVRDQVISEMMSNPEIAGAREAMDKVKSILRPYVLSADTEKVVAAKDSQIKALEAKIKAMATQLQETSGKLAAMTEAAKEMGFNLYLERNLSALPKSKFKRIVESVGDYSKIATLAELKKRVGPAVEEARGLVEDRDLKIKKLTEQLNARTEEVEVLREEMEDALQASLENAARLYLERKLTGNPYAGELRQRFEGLQVKTKGAVDKLVAESRATRGNENSDFTKVRARLQQSRGFKTSDNLVEERVKETFPDAGRDKQFEPLSGHKFSMSEINKLAGVR